LHAGSKFAVSVIAGAGLLLTVRSVQVRGQEQAPAAGQQHVPANRSVILLDAAHGGTDPGADLGNKVAEKDVTLAVAAKLRATLAAQGFTVVLTRDSDAAAAITAEQRAETANRSHALACLSLHATRSGSGVHIYTSALQPMAEAPDTGTSVPFIATRWESAQEGFVARSTQLAAGLKSAIADATLPADVRMTTIPPLDNLMCPAVAVEFAPLGPAGNALKGAEDSGYQDSAVRALTAALVKWRTATAATLAPSLQPVAPMPKGDQ
jgi:N-acetylmuramoyl-L-alanine amidase